MPTVADGVGENALSKPQVRSISIALLHTLLHLRSAEEHL